MTEPVREQDGAAQIRVGQMVLGPLPTNSYYIYRASDQEQVPVAVIDPPEEGERICDALRKRGFWIEEILLTHGHFDHIGGVRGILRRAGEEGRHVPVACLDAERGLCGDVDLNCSLSVGGCPLTVSPDVFLRDGETIEVADVSLRVIATPGHTEGGCCFYVEEAGLLFSGDTLFAESVGRSDFPTGSMATLLRSIRERLLILPEDTLVLPGHGEETTIGHEKRHNFFLA